MNFTSINVDSNGDQEKFNNSLIQNEDFICIKSHQKSLKMQMDLPDQSQDLIYIHNLVSSGRDQKLLLQRAAEKLKPGGLLFVFEPFVRELRAKPNDLIRHTPRGLAHQIEDQGLSVIKIETDGSPFEIISYTWMQALEYLPEERRKEVSSWFYKEELPRLQNFNLSYTQNLERNDSSFPMAMAVTAYKPVES